MLKVKVYDEEHEADLEERVNKFLSSISEEHLKDIQYQVGVSLDENGEQVYCFSAMIIYRTKGQPL